jgi:anaerobic ribonucleoside-triphosphate reductase activating protein
MNYMVIKKLDVANGPGCRVSLFVSGCDRKCKECFNPESWNPNNGEKFTEETKQEIIEALNNPYIKGFSILGGDPFFPDNRKNILDLVKDIKKTYPYKTIWIWTGYKLEDLIEDLTCKEIIGNIDFLVDGEFRIEEKDLKLQFSGSKNQRVIDLKDSNTELIIRDSYDWTKIKVI